MALDPRETGRGEAAARTREAWHRDAAAKQAAQRRQQHCACNVPDPHPPLSHQPLRSGGAGRRHFALDYLRPKNSMEKFISEFQTSEHWRAHYPVAKNVNNCGRAHRACAAVAAVAAIYGGQRAHRHVLCAAFRRRQRAAPGHRQLARAGQDGGKHKQEQGATCRCTSAAGRACVRRVVDPNVPPPPLSPRFVTRPCPARTSPSAPRPPPPPRSSRPSPAQATWGAACGPALRPLPAAGAWRPDTSTAKSSTVRLCRSSTLFLPRRSSSHPRPRRHLSSSNRRC